MVILKGVEKDLNREVGTENTIAKIYIFLPL